MHEQVTDDNGFECDFVNRPRCERVQRMQCTHSQNIHHKNISQKEETILAVKSFFPRKFQRNFLQIIDKYIEYNQKLQS